MFETLLGGRYKKTKRFFFWIFLLIVTVYLPDPSGKATLFGFVLFGGPIYWVLAGFTKRFYRKLDSAKKEHTEIDTPVRHDSTDLINLAILGWAFVNPLTAAIASFVWVVYASVTRLRIDPAPYNQMMSVIYSLGTAFIIFFFLEESEIGLVLFLATTIFTAGYFLVVGQIAINNTVNTWYEKHEKKERARVKEERLAYRAMKEQSATKKGNKLATPKDDVKSKAQTTDMESEAHVRMREQTPNLDEPLEFKL